MKNKTINIDQKKLLDDLYYMRNILVNNPSKNTIKYDFNDFQVLNEAMASVSKKMFDLNPIFDSNPGMEKFHHDFYIGEMMKFYSTMYDNKDLLLKIFGSYSDNLDKIKFVKFPFYGTIKRYNEEDFKNIIFEFYSRYGNDIYKIAKKYFDESRIQAGYRPMNPDNFSAMYSCITPLYSGYIFSTSNTFNSMSAKSIVHELGHAIDAEMFKFPQQKTLSIGGDTFLEIPSLCFDLSFARYLIDSKIDYTGGLVIDNYETNYIDDCGADIEDTFALENIVVDTDGFALDTETNEKINIRFAIIYGISGYFALHFDELARSDMKEFRKVFNNIITSRKECSLEELIEKFGISTHDFIEGKYIKKKIQENNLALKKRFNYYE